MLPTSTSVTPNSTLLKLAADGSNWIIWRTRMQVFLGAKFAQYLNSSTTSPAKPQPLDSSAKEEAVKKYEKDNETYLEWTQAETEVRHYIFSTIPDSLLVQMISCTASADLWKAICTKHEGKTNMFGMEMTRRIHNECCTDADDACAHLAKMVRLREELAATGEMLDDDSFAFILTNSLPESYGSAISTTYTTATMNDKTPTIQQTIGVVETEYARRQISNGGLPGSVALLSSQQNPSSSKKQKKKAVCTNTKCRFRYNHEFKDCRSIGGPMYTPNPPGRSLKGNAMRSRRCVRTQLKRRQTTSNMPSTSQPRSASPTPPIIRGSIKALKSTTAAPHATCPPICALLRRSQIRILVGQGYSWTLGFVLLLVREYPWTGTVL